MIVQTTTDEYVKLRKNTFTKEGYVFSHWQYNHSYFYDKIMFDEDTVLSKEFKPYKYLGDMKEVYLTAVWVKAENAQKITMHKNDDSANESIYLYRNTTSTFYDLCKYFNKRFTRSGYTLAGLSKVPNATTVFYSDWRDNDKLGTDEITLYGIWKNDNCIVIYHANYEGAPEETITKEYPKTESSYLELLFPFNRDGYKFRGYITSSSYASTYYPDATRLYFSGNALNVLDVYAYWLKEDEVYTVIYHSNTDADETYTQYVGNFDAIGSERKFNAIEYLGYGSSRVKFEKENWDSYTWNTKPDLSGVKYNSSKGYSSTLKTSFSQDMFDSSKELHLYVDWYYTKILIEYMSANSAITTDDGAYVYYDYTGKDKYGPIYFLPNMFTKNIPTGRRFKCWEYSGQEYNEGDVMNLSNISTTAYETTKCTVRAKWE